MIYCNRLLNRDGSYSYEVIMPLPLSMIRQYFKKIDFYYHDATVIISKKLMDSICGWNETMFMYYEDLHLFYKAHRQGIHIKQIPAITQHYGGGSSEKAFSNIKHEIISQKSLRTFYKTNDINLLYYFIYIFLSCIRIIRYRKPRLLKLLF